MSKSLIFLVLVPMGLITAQELKLIFYSWRRQVSATY